MRIAAIAHSIPSRRVETDDLIREVIDRNAARYGPADLARLRERLRAYMERTGIRTRYWRVEGEKAGALAVDAGRRALDEAGLRPGDVDLLLYVGVGRGWLEPAMANFFLAELGLTNATGFDILDACASWLRALDLAADLIRLGRHSNVMILNGEFNVREYCDADLPHPGQLESLLPRFTIGEAATATVVTGAGPEDTFHALFKTWGAHHELCRIPLPNQAEYRLHDEERPYDPLLFYAHGTRLTRLTVGRLVATFREDPFFRALKPDIGFGHSVSEPVTAKVERLLELPPGLFYRTVATHGNTVSASLPLGMSLAQREGRLRRGQQVLFLMGSAGISVGLAALTF